MVIMKKLLSITLCIAMLFSLALLAGCSSEPENLKFGFGAISYIDEVKNAAGATNGSVATSTTFAAVTLDADGKIVNCKIDTIDCTLGFTGDGKYVKAENLATKQELGENYNMKKKSPIKREWNEQADAFAKVAEGKTLQDVKALIVNDGKGNDEVVNAGCTITISDFVKAVEKAVNNAKDSTATSEDALKIGVVATATGKDAAGIAAGTADVKISVTAAAVKDGKATAMVTDAIEITAAFDAKGKTPVVSGNIATKLERGVKYNMKQNSPIKREWYEQAAAFDKECIGKTASEIAGLATGDTLTKAGCTIDVTDMLKAAEKAVK